MNQQNKADEPLLGIDIIGLLRAYGRKLVLTALGVGVVVGLIGALYLVVLQPVRHTYTVEFRPTFEGASEGEYPNGLPFAFGDVTARPVVDLVYDRNKIEDYCSRADFGGGLFVEQFSMQSMFLDAEYSTRLADPRLTTIERERLQEEYQAKREALPIGSRLVFVRPDACEGMPTLLVTKVMTEVLETWAQESEAKRGVLSLQVQILTPSMLDTELPEDSSGLLRADVIRVTLQNIVQNVQDVIKLQGAGLVRLEDGTTLLAVRNKLRDLIKFQLEPLVAVAGRSMAAESVDWVREMTAVAQREVETATGQADAYRTALREFAGVAQVDGQGRQERLAQNSTGSTDVQTLSPIIDRSFIDTLVTMSEQSTQFKQDLATKMVEAEVVAVVARERVAYYSRLTQEFQQGRTSKGELTDVRPRLDAIIEQGKALTAKFNALYDEFSRVSLRAGGALYHVEAPVAMRVTRAFTPANLGVMVLMSALVVLLLGFVFVAFRDRLQTTRA